MCHLNDTTDDEEDEDEDFDAGGEDDSASSGGSLDERAGRCVEGLRVKREGKGAGQGQEFFVWSERWIGWLRGRGERASCSPCVWEVSLYHPAIARLGGLQLCTGS